MKNYKSVRLQLTLLQKSLDGIPLVSSSKYYDVGSDDHNRILHTMSSHAKGELTSVVFTDALGNVVVHPKAIVEVSVLSEDHSILSADEANQREIDRWNTKREFA